MKKTNKTIGIILLIITVLCIVVGGIQIKNGFDRKNNYLNSEYGLLQNAYVGGDAYNYIINGTYFTGYVTFGSALLIIGTMTGIFGVHLLLTSKSDEYTEYSQLPPL